MADQDKLKRLEKLLHQLGGAALDALDAAAPIKAAHKAFVAIAEYWRDHPERGSEVDAKLRALETEIDRASAASRDDAQDRAIARLRAQVAEFQQITGPLRPVGPGEEELARYRDKLRSLHETFELFGLPGFVVPQRLDSLYVELDVIVHREITHRRVFAAAEYAAEAPDLERQRLPLVKTFAEAKKHDQRGLVLLGDPGAGKTFLLRKILLHVLGRDPTTLGLPADVVPIFVPLHAVRDRKTALPDLIAERMADPLLDLPASFATRLCTHAHLLLLFDGLDEVANAGERREVAHWIQQILRAAPHSYAIVTCRYAGYSDDVALASGFLELHLRPLDTRQMEQLVRNWYREVIGFSTGKAENAHTRAQAKADALLQVLAEHFRVDSQAFAMTRNPLLLTVICLVHHSVGELPHGRAELYKTCIDVLLRRWQEREQKALPALTKLEPRDIARILRPVAAWMHGVKDRRLASGAELTEPLRPALADTSIAPEAFLATIRDEAGVLTGWGIDTYGFIHLGLQEFLTATHWRDLGAKQNAAHATLAAKFDESWWQEVILLMLALDQGPAFEPFMRALVEQPRFGEWAKSPMLDRCFDESADKSVAPFVELLQRGDPRPWWARALGLRKAELAGLVERQIGAAEVLRRHAKGELDGLMGVLERHPHAGLRAWVQAQRQPALERGQTIVVQGVELVLIRGGKHWMGSPPGQGYGDEQPRHQVELADFHLARTPVTNAQYRRYLEANPRVEPPEYWSNSQFNQPNQPVVGVSWRDAMAYCKWAGLVLPTEAQWEVACRAGSDAQYCNGDGEAKLDEVGWYAKNSGDRLHAVAEKQPNAWGLYDMHGNVWEWCRDGAAGGYEPYSTPAQPVDGLRREPDTDGPRVVRGGGFDSASGDARSAFRYGYLADHRFQLIGFRPARVIS